MQAVRLDSGDLARSEPQGAPHPRPDTGLKDVSIFASGNLDEYRIKELIQAGAPIDAFGVGTAMVVSAGRPGARRRLQARRVRRHAAPQDLREQGEPAGPQAGFSRAQSHWRLLRRSDRARGRECRHRRAANSGPRPAEVKRCSTPVFADGRRLDPRPALNDARERSSAQFAVLDARYRQIDQPDPYPVRHSAALNALLINERLRAEKRQA